MKIGKILNNLGMVTKNVVTAAGLGLVTVGTGAVVVSMLSGGNQGASAPITRTSYSDVAQYGSGEGGSGFAQYGSNMDSTSKSMQAARQSASGSGYGAFAPSNTPATASGGSARASAAPSGGAGDSGSGFGGMLEGMGIGRDAAAQNELKGQLASAQAQADAAAAAAGGNKMQAKGLDSLGISGSRRSGGGSYNNQYAGGAGGAVKDAGAAQKLAGQQLSGAGANAGGSASRDRANRGRVQGFNQGDVGSQGSALEAAKGREVSGSLRQAHNIRKTLASADGKNVSATFIDETFQNAGENKAGISVAGAQVAPESSNLTLGDIEKSNKQTAFEAMGTLQLENDLRKSRENTLYAMASLLLVGLSALAIVMSALPAPWKWIVYGAGMALVVAAYAKIFIKHSDGVNPSSTAKTIAAAMVTAGAAVWTLSAVSSKFGAFMKGLPKVFSGLPGIVQTLGGMAGATFITTAVSQLIKGSGAEKKALKDAKLYNSTAGRSAK
ncbi:hypothetical protein Emin_0645 [Elusimicrobium minutum Pei191]|uniref:Uncharacterized protein n=1 Tax=Elusimicrobium minutum (strain Pei191) TaxID=445932 RepID=B2KC73_ELUMP|nr:hypothetical protein [Elusimicrobium minutum]ACC98200.1 hypothetical protein Emin_0645 [Elusimicrobium minutum Pei191]